MPVDLLELRNQIKAIAKSAPAETQTLKDRRAGARDLLLLHENEVTNLRNKVERAAQVDRFLRCAKPVSEPLSANFPQPDTPEHATVIAADGSQIPPDRNQPVNYYLINVGAIVMVIGSAASPDVHVHTEVFSGQDLYTPGGTVSEELVAQQRDLKEREILASIAEHAAPPVFTLTDGPLELWGRKGSGEENRTFTESLQTYQESLTALKDLGAATAGYVDKPRADYVVQLLEIASAHVEELASVRKNRPLRGVTDASLFGNILAPGERSAVFAIQSTSSGAYKGPLALHFFYLNVGQPKKPWLARVEIPAWVAGNATMLNNLHAVLVGQCRILGLNTYPYLLHRSHEIAVVTYEEREQITAMLMQEYLQQGVEFGELSHKQAAKNYSARRRFSLGK